MVALTFFCTTSCQLMLRKNLCSMTSLASLGPPPSLGRDGREHPPPGAASWGDTLSAGLGLRPACPEQPLVPCPGHRPTLTETSEAGRELSAQGQGREPETWPLAHSVD